MASKRDYSYEALAEATNCDMVGNRGELNIALKTIREMEPAKVDMALADEIHRRARIYAEVMGHEIMLTPTALAKHWVRCESSPKPVITATNQHGTDAPCETCDGHRFVVMRTRPVVQSMWAREKGTEPPADSHYEEMAACPSCNSADYSYTRFDGSRFRQPDPALVLEYLSR